MTERWRADLPAESRSGVTVEGTTAFVAGVDGSITAIDVGDGSTTWSEDVGGPIEVPLTVADATVVAVVRDVDAREVTIVARSATDGSQSFAPLTSRIGSTAASSAAIVDGAIVIGMPDRLVHAISADGGTELWTSLALSVFSPASSAAFAGDTVYVADVSAGLYAFDRASGERAWAFQFNDLVVRSAPVRVGGYVLVGLATGRLVAVDAETGHLVWSGRGGPGLVGTIAVGADVVVAVSGGRDAGLVAFESDPEGGLVDVASPTQLDAGVTLPRIAIGAAIALAVILLPGVLYRRRFGPVSLEEGIGDEVADGDELADAAIPTPTPKRSRGEQEARSQTASGAPARGRGRRARRRRSAPAASGSVRERDALERAVADAGDRPLALARGPHRGRVSRSSWS